MLDNDKFRMTLSVANGKYPLFCKRSEEELFRKAAKAIDNKIFQYSSRFSGDKIEVRDLLVMAAIHFSAELLLYKQKEDKSPMLEKIEFLNKELEEYLQEV